MAKKNTQANGAQPPLPKPRKICISDLNYDPIDCTIPCILGEDGAFVFHRLAANDDLRKWEALAWAYRGDIGLQTGVLLWDTREGTYPGNGGWPATHSVAVNFDPKSLRDVRRAVRRVIECIESTDDQD